MSDEMEVLYEVQQADTETARLKDALAGLDAGEQLEAEVAAAESELSARRTLHHAAENESLDRDLEVKALQEKKAKFEAQLYGGTVRNPRQLSDLQGEVAMLAREIGKIEDRLLELMEVMETGRSEIAGMEARLSEQRERLQSVKDEYQRTRSRLQGETAALEARRQELAGRIGPYLLKRYEQIRARQGNVGLVRVTGSTCPGCRIALPSETLKALKADIGKPTCENCGRLMFWDGS